MQFEEAFQRLIGHEGGLSIVTDDPGNWTGGAVGAGKLVGTKFGISAASFPGEDIRNLTLDRAKQLYLHNYWGPAGCDSVPDAIRFDLFDMAVNSGVKASVRTLQLAAGAAVDGVLGPKTLQAVSVMSGPQLVARFNGARLAYMASLKAWPSFSRGWSLRIASNLMKA
jgi:lysozyme family protein